MSNLDRKHCCIERSRSSRPMTMQCISFSMVTRRKADAGQTAAGQPDELELVMISMTKEWLKTMKHMGKQGCYIFALPLMLSTATNGQYNNNLSHWSPRMKTAHTMISMPPLENSSQRAAEGQIKVDVIQAEPEATAKRTSSQDNLLFKPDWTCAD